MEEWRDVVGFEGYYEVSNTGLVRRKDTGHILAQQIRRGYASVHLSGQGVKSRQRVNRIVATAFIENPHNYPYVNHKDEDKSNNRVENLEWCTAHYNANYGTRNVKLKVPVIIVETGMVYDSVTDASAALGCSASLISEVCRGKKETVRGYHVEYLPRKYQGVGRFIYGSQVSRHPPRVH